MFKYFLEVTALVYTQGMKTPLSFSSLIKAQLRPLFSIKTALLVPIF